MSRTKHILSYSIPIVILLFFLFGSFFAPHDPTATNIRGKYLSSSAEYPFGTDDFGRCEFSRILEGGKITLGIVLVGSAIVILLGIFFGILLAKTGRRRNILAESILNAVTAIPPVAYLIIFIGIWGNSIPTMLVALTASLVLRMIKLVKTLIEGEYDKAYIMCAIACGASKMRIMLVHILPNIIRDVVQFICLSCAEMIIAISGFSFIPYFAIAYIMLCLIDGVTALNTYALWCGVILLGFTLKLFFSTLSTTVSHTATFQTLKEIRIKIADKLSRVPMGYIMDQSSGRFKDVIVDRVESMEPILAHLVPEMTSNLFVPLCIIVYLFVLDWRMALASLVTLPIGFLCYMEMSRGYSERFSGLMKRVQKMNATIIEYVGGIEVIKAFNQSANSYQKYSDAVNDDASYAIDWMKDTQLFMSMSNTIWPSVWLAVLPIGAVLYQHGTLSAPVFLTIMILSLGIVGPILGAIKFTDNISQLGTIVGEVGNLLDAPELVRPDHNADIHNQSIDPIGVKHLKEVVRNESKRRQRAQQRILAGGAA